MTKKYFFFDIDGTLTSASKFDNTFIPSGLETIKELERQGHFVACATGRPLEFAKAAMNSIGITNIIANGGYTGFVDDKLIFNEGLHQDVVKEILDICKKEDIAYALTSDGEFAFRTSSEVFKKQIEEREGIWVSIELVSEDEVFSITPVSRLLVDLKFCELGYPNRFRDCVFMLYNTPFYMVEPDNKFYGIEHLMKLMNAPLEDVVAFGDGINDIAMLDKVALGIAMGNAVDEVKAVADYVTDTSDHDGIQKACKYFEWVK